MSWVDEHVAGLAGVNASVAASARKIEAIAKTLAAGHGGLAGDISTERVNRYDVDVVMDHTHALSIEYGHEDVVFGSGWVPGLHIMRDAARAAT